MRPYLRKNRKQKRAGGVQPVVVVSWLSQQCPELKPRATKRHVKEKKRKLLLLRLRIPFLKQDMG
jgi:hypothetical protein